tara:strand:- start:714 stop:824 length:111 start_codon:yes stop_codon:yes gene_type:complete
VQNDIQDFAKENPDLVVETIDDLIQEIPAGTWGESA